MPTTEFQINGLAGELDGAELTRSLCAMPGVAAAYVDVTTGTVTLIQERSSQGRREIARRVVRDAGYEVASDVPQFGVALRARGPLRRWVRQPVPAQSPAI